MEYCPAGELYVRIRQLQKDVVRLPEEVRMALNPIQPIDR